MKKQSIQILKNLQYPSGLFAAASKDAGTGYHMAWIRDNVYTAIGLESSGHVKDAVAAYHALLDILIKHEYKIDHAIAEKPQHKHQYIHARFDPHTLEEKHEEWGNMQNDAIGALLFKIGDLEEKNISVIRSNDDIRILQKLVHYLLSIEYWHDQDNGIWEENEEVHASSVGACLAGLQKISSHVAVPRLLLDKGRQALNALLPRESTTKDVDLALLSLIYPYNIVTTKQRDQILKNVEEKLVRGNGVIRYEDDYYYNEDGEAEWTMGFPWLARIYKELENYEKYSFYIGKTHSVVNQDGELPELYYANTEKHNENSPLAWSHALFLTNL